MDTLIIAINSKYIHQALSVWYLKANCRKACDVLEFTINEPVDSVYREIFSHMPKTIAFACYIWNIDMVLRLAQMLKKALPDVTIILGGPEVSYDSVEILEKYDFIDYIICGEGEQAFDSLITDNIITEGVTHRTSQGINKGQFQLVADLDSISSPYTDEMLSNVPYGSVYYEASRGCPFNCGYCLSSTFKGVRRFSFDRIKRDITRICESGVKQIKFVDRTFNCDAQYTIDFINWLKDNTGDVNLHFEVASDLLNDELIELLGALPSGKVQLEAGVQSMNRQTIEAVSRRTDLDKVLSNARRIMSQGNIHLHLDLIAGLPYEDYNSFKKSFDLVYSVNPHNLQLGFLKLLKGSRLRREEEHDFKFDDYAPYEIISNKYISAQELIHLHKVEDVLDRYYNSGRFTKTLEYLVTDSPFDFYERFADFAEFTSSPSADVLYERLYQFANDERTADLLKLDFLASIRHGRLPAFLDSGVDLKKQCFEYLKETEPENEARARYKQVRLEYFKAMDKYILFDYSKQNPVTGRYDYKDVDIKKGLR